MTLEAWVYPTTISNDWRDVVYKGDDNYYLMATTTSGSRPAAGGTFGGRANDAFGTKLTANVWTHLAATYDGTALKLYVNGTISVTKALTGALSASANPLQVGGDTVYGQYFSGRIDEVRVYRVALSQAEIQADMAAPLGGCRIRRRRRRCWGRRRVR